MGIFSFALVLRGWWRCVLVAMLWLCAVVAVGQQIDFQVVATPTAGSCLSDGALRAEVINSTAEDGVLYQYRLINNTTGVTGSPVRTTDKVYTYTNLVVGDYQVEVVAMTRGSVTRKSPGVSVSSTFVPPVVQMDNERSRYSFACGTGRIVLNITGGRGEKAIKIASGPMRVGETIDYTKTNDTTYQLEGETWLPGKYSLEVTDDACGYTAQTAVTLTELPPFALGISSGQGVRFYNGDGNCNQVLVPYNWRYFSQTNRLASHYYKYIEMGMIEAGMQMPWEDESAIQWVTLTPSVDISFTLPYTYKEYYERVNATRWKYASHHFRLKNCPEIKKQETASAEASIKIIHNLSALSYSFIKDNSRTSYPNALCPPVTATMRRKSDNQLLGEAVQAQEGARSSSFDLAPELFVNNTPVTLSYSDAEGLGGEEEFVLSHHWAKSSERVIEGDCDRFNYTMSFQFIIMSASGSVISSSSVTDSEISQIQEVSIYNSQGVLVERKVLDASIPIRDRRRLTFALPEGEMFTLKYLWRGVWHEETFRATSKRYASPALYINADNEQLGYSEIDAQLGDNSTNSNRYIPSGSIVTLIGPNGEELARKEYRRGTFEGGKLSGFGGVKLWPRGEYTLRFYNSCTGETQESKAMCYGGFKIEEFTYTIEYECGEAYVVPRAKLVVNEAEGSFTHGFFFIHQKKAAVEERVVESGGRIKLSAAGDYILSLTLDHRPYEDYKKYYNAPKSSDMRLSDIVVHYDGVESLTIDERNSLQYACGPGQEGLILLKAKNGRRPYTYTLYHTAEDRERDENVVDRRVESDSEAFFYGREGQHYYVKVTDDCGASYSYDFLLQDISNISMVYVYPKRACYGSEVEFSMLGPESFRRSIYALWYDPQGNPLREGVDYVIDHVTTEQAGRYKVEYRVPMCNELYTAYVDLQVDMPIDMGTVPTNNYTTCVGRSTKIIGPTLREASEEVHWEQAFAERFAPGADTSDPNAEMQYVWSSSMLQGNTQTKDYRTCFSTPGTYVLRPVVRKGGCSYDGSPIFVKVKRCTVPINPHLMHNAVVDWSKFDKQPTNMAR